MRKYAITFGHRYAWEDHPVLGPRPDLPNGWLSIEAIDEFEARTWLRDNIANAYAFIYPMQSFLEESAAWFPLGHLGDVKELVLRRIPESTLRSILRHHLGCARTGRNTCLEHTGEPWPCEVLLNLEHDINQWAEELT